MALQSANNVAITGGSVDGIVFDGGTFCRHHAADY
jgi:hypothetical protein